MKSFTPLEAMKRHKRRLVSLTGFTLIELVIVIIVVSVLAAAWVFVSSEPNKLNGAANKLMSDLRYAQQLAISRQVPCGASFDVLGNNYFAYIGTTATKAVDPYSGGELLVAYNAASEYRGVQLVSTNFDNRIYFDYLGRPYNNSGNLLSSQGAIVLQFSSHTSTVIIKPNTGEVRVQ